jgi:hypothetical protein
VIGSTDGLDDRRFIIDVPAHGAPVYAADDDHRLTTTTRPVVRELLRVVSALRCELVERDVCREQLIDGVRHTVELPESGDREPRTTTVADHVHDLNRVGICVLLVPFAEERSAARGSRRAGRDRFDEAGL